MTIRQEVRQRARRAATGFYFGVLVGATMMVLVCIALDIRDRSRDHRMKSAWEPLVGIGGFLSAALVMVTGPAYAHRMGRSVCCDATWPVLNIGRDLARMKCCPYCGRSLDDELPAATQAGKPPKKDHSWEDELS